MQGDVVEDGDIGAVGERDVPELHLSRDRKRFGGWRIVGLGRFVEDFKHALARGPPSLEDLVELVKPADGLVEKSGKQQESGEVSDAHFVAQDGLRTEGDDEGRAEGGEQGHRGVVDRPDAHDHERGLLKGAAERVEAAVFLVLADVGLDLADAGQIVVEQRVHGGRGLALAAVAQLRSEGVGERAAGEERDGGQAPEGEGRVVGKEHRRDDDDLKDSDGALLDAVDEDALDGVDVLHDAGHDVAGGAVVKPAERQPLDVGVQVAAQVEDDFLLEAVVEQDADRVEQVAGNECSERPAH